MIFAAWNSEERGLLGAWAYAEDPVVPLDRIVAVLNMDMIGRNEEVPVGRRRALPRPRAADGGVECERDQHHRHGAQSGSARGARARPIKAIGLELKFRYDNNISNLMRRSDHWPFIQHGVPGVWVHTGLHPDYHTVYDRPEKINYAKMAKITRLVYQASLGSRQRAVAPATAAGGGDVERQPVKLLAAGLVLVVFVPAFGLLPVPRRLGLRARGARRGPRRACLGLHLGPDRLALVAAVERLRSVDVSRRSASNPTCWCGSLNAAALFGSLLLFHAVARRFSFSRPATIAGMCLLAFAQVNAHPFYSFDGYTQLLVRRAGVGLARLRAAGDDIGHGGAGAGCSGPRSCSSSWRCSPRSPRSPRSPACASSPGGSRCVEPVTARERRGMIALALAAATAGRRAGGGTRSAIAGWLSNDDPYNRLLRSAACRGTSDC